VREVRGERGEKFKLQRIKGLRGVVLDNDALRA